MSFFDKVIASLFANYRIHKFIQSRILFYKICCITMLPMSSSIQYIVVVWSSNPVLCSHKKDSELKPTGVYFFFLHQTSVLKPSNAISIFVIVESSPPVLFMNESSAFFEWISDHEWTDSHSTTPPPSPSERPGSLGERGVGEGRNFIDFMRMLHPGCTINGCGGWIDGERVSACGDESSWKNPPLSK